MPQRSFGLQRRDPTLRGMALSPPRLRVCRLCGRNSDEVRFRPTSARRCAPCQDTEKAERQSRLAVRAASPLFCAPVRKPRGRRSGKCEPHLAWVRSLPCAIHGPRCGTNVHAHHVRCGTGGGTGKKPPDKYAAPLCAAHHLEGHTSGWQTFETKYRVNLLMLAESLAGESPHRGLLR